MTGTTLDIYTSDAENGLATSIAARWMEWQGMRNKWLTEKREIRDYIFATDTSKTGNAKLPWRNSTTTPKLCQIRDNLQANYMAALFPHQDWLMWEGDSQEAETEGKRIAILNYMRNKTRQSDLRTTVSQLLYDYIDYGNVFATIEWVNDTKVNEDTGETTAGYVGPKLVRISPEDIVFNPVASSFNSTPKIVRSFISMGELTRMAEKENDPEAKEMITIARDGAQDLRTKYAAADQREKQRRFQIDGFGSLDEYFQTGLLEVLTFYGDMYDATTGELLEDHIITIVDRKFLVSKKANPSWFKGQNIFHVGWRERQDNLYAMGPLDNLVGMQYRIDHLENLKADAFDLIAFPIIKVRGFIEDFDYEPGARIHVGDEGDVEFMRPDVTVLNADTQIAILENKMEEMAGAPKQAMGFRTPGEKTAFEVQSLENAANRIFLNKVAHFEEVFLEKVLNAELEVSRRQLDVADTIRVFDEETSAVLFQTITKEDITAAGRLRPRGASRFARKAQMTQNLNNLYNSAIGQDPAVNTHISGFETAKMMEDLLELDPGTIVQKDVRLFEQAETQKTAQAIQQEMAVEQSQVTSRDEELL